MLYQTLVRLFDKVKYLFLFFIELLFLRSLLLNLLFKKKLFSLCISLVLYNLTTFPVLVPFCVNQFWYLQNFVRKQTLLQFWWYVGFYYYNLFEGNKAIQRKVDYYQKLDKLVNFNLPARNTRTIFKASIANLGIYIPKVYLTFQIDDANKRSFNN